MKVVLPVAFTWLAFAWYLGPALDQELASAGALSERGSDREALGARSDAPGVGATPASTRSESAPSPPVVKHTSSADVVQGKSAVWWARRAIQNKRDANARGRTIRRLQHAQLRASEHFFGWLAGADCVHEHEGNWRAHTGNGYFGGMQADIQFQRTYAPDLIARYGGWAHTWPWYAQLQMAYRGWLFRGWQPWPNTSRACGLR